MEPEPISTDQISRYRDGNDGEFTSSSASTKTPRRLLLLANSTAAPITDSLESFSSTLEGVGTEGFALLFPHSETKKTGSAMIKRREF